MRFDKPRIVPYKKILGNLIRIQYSGAIWNSLKRGLLFYQRRSHAIVLHDTLPAVCIEKVVCMKTNDELFQNVRLTPRVPQVVLQSNSQIGLQDQREQDARSYCEKPGATPWITEFLVYLFLQSNSKVHIVKTKSKSWSRSSRTTRTKNPSFKTWSRRRRSTSSARNRSNWSPTWTPRSSNFAKHLQNSNALNATYTGKHCLRWVKRRSTTATTMSCPYPALLSNRITSAAPDMDLLNDSECTTRLKKCNIKRVKRNMEDTHPFLRGGTQNCPGKSIIRPNKSWENSKLRTLDSKIEAWWCSATVKSRTRLCSSEKRMQTIARRVPGKDPARPQNHSSKPARKTKKRTSVRRNWRMRLCGRSSNGLEVLLTSAGKSVAFVAIVLVHKLGTQQLDHKKSDSLAFITVWPFVNFFSESGPVSVGREINFPTTDGEVDISHSLSMRGCWKERIGCVCRRRKRGGGRTLDNDNDSEISPLPRF